MSCVFGLGVVLGLAGGSSADVIAAGSSATVRWTPATGPVSGYQVWVSRNGADFVEIGLVNGNEVMLSGGTGDVLEVAVRAWGVVNGGFEWGPESEGSERIWFVGAPVAADRYPVLDCTSCRRFEERDASGDVVVAATHPAGNDYELVGLGVFAPGRPQALLRERSMGALWIGDVSGAGLMPYWSQWDPTFTTSRVARPIDLDGDGATEILLHDDANGRFQIWGFVNNQLVRRAQYSLAKGMPLIGAGDSNGDGKPDAWFDAGHGILLIVRLVGATMTGSAVLGVSSADLSLADVADYDGDNLADGVWRDETTGRLYVSLMRGTVSAPRLDMVPLPAAAGDIDAVVRTSLDVDGQRGAEILLQNRISGAVDVVKPTATGTRQRLLVAGANWRLVGLE
jgi:hypothetical protein